MSFVFCQCKCLSAVLLYENLIVEIRDECAGILKRCLPEWIDICKVVFMQILAHDHTRPRLGLGFAESGDIDE